MCIVLELIASFVLIINFSFLGACGAEKLIGAIPDETVLHGHSFHSGGLVRDGEQVAVSAGVDFAGVRGVKLGIHVADFGRLSLGGV